MKSHRRCSHHELINGCPISPKHDMFSRSFPGAKFARKCEKHQLGVNITSKKRNILVVGDRIVITNPRFNEEAYKRLTRD